VLVSVAAFIYLFIYLFVYLFEVGVLPCWSQTPELKVMLLPQKIDTHFALREIVIKLY
jgi:hypothetical protein